MTFQASKVIYVVRISTASPHLLSFLCGITATKSRKRYPLVVLSNLSWEPSTLSKARAFNLFCVLSFHYICARAGKTDLNQPDFDVFWFNPVCLVSNKHRVGALGLNWTFFFFLTKGQKQVFLASLVSQFSELP